MSYGIFFAGFPFCIPLVYSSRASLLFLFFCQYIAFYRSKEKKKKYIYIYIYIYIYLNLYEMFHNYTCRFFDIVNRILVERWTKIHTPLHCLAHSLNPR